MGSSGYNVPRVGEVHDQTVRYIINSRSHSRETTDTLRTCKCCASERKHGRTTE
jgi:hypothetical protein